MPLRIGFALLSWLMLTGCGPSQRDYDQARKRAADLEAEVSSLQQQVVAMKSELDEIKNGPERLLALGKSATSDRDIVTALKTLIERHPDSDEAKLAGPLLLAAESRISEAELAARKIAAMKEVCRVEGKRIAPYFAGTDIAKVMDAFQKSKLKNKDEFETTASYESRLKNELPTIADPRQCVILDGSGTEYDADRQHWKVGVYSFGDYGYMGADRKLGRVHEFILESRSESKGTYTGSNAFGVSREIERRAEFKTGVRFPEQSFNRAMAVLGARDDDYKQVVSIPMLPEQAKGIAKYHLKFLVEYEWSPGFVDEETDHHSPKIDEPWDSVTTTRFVLGKPIRILVINQNTGEVLAPK